MLLWLGGPQARQGFHAVGQILTVAWIFDSSLRPSEGAGSCNVAYNGVEWDCPHARNEAQYTTLG